jgi:hypothetical protein
MPTRVRIPLPAFMNYNKIVIIDLKENLNEIDHDQVLHLTMDDISDLKLIEGVLKKHFGRPWIYAGSGLPRAPKDEMLKEIDKLDLDHEKKDKLKKLAVEKKIPAEVLVVLEEGDGNHLHSHGGSVSAGFQMEQYMIPEGKILNLEIIVNKKSEILRIRGPSAVILGDIVHQRKGGECFVVKFPSGEFKRTVS